MTPNDAHEADDTYETSTDDLTLEAQTSDLESSDSPSPMSGSLASESAGDDISGDLTDEDPEVQAARQAFDQDASESEQTDEQDDARVAELATPYVGRWNTLISTTNWEKGRIIADWRAALVESGVSSTQYSDEAWARRVGGVTAPHVGRLRRVHERFASTFESYEGLYWSHFLAALDWEDAPLWLEGAVQSGWSVAGMREQRWQAHGAVDSQRPTSSEVIEVDLDEDIVVPDQPAQGDSKTREYGDDPGAAMGKTYEDADFGDGDELQSLAGPAAEGGGIGSANESDDPSPSPVQPFAGLPDLPDDLADAIEMMKLAILRHKSNQWEKVDIDIVAKYLEAVGVLLRSP